MHIRTVFVLFVLCALFVVPTTSAQNELKTVGITKNNPDKSYNGYTLFSPLFYNTSYLIDNEGQLIQSWEHTGNAGAATYLLPNGNLLHAQAAANEFFTFGGQGGIMREMDWDGDVVWEFFYSDSLRALHHDMAVLPNGNILMIAWVFKSIEESIENGRDPALLTATGFWPEEIIEVQPTPPVGGEIVWRWDAWDHLIQDFDSTKANYGDVAAHPELIDINHAPAANGDWLHFNAVNYNAELDQIIISAPGFNEMWIIDHSTTTEEAAGHTGGNYGRGGDLLYRWGNPAAYRKSSPEGRQLGFQHDTQWIEPGLPGEGNLLVFNNQRSLDTLRFSNILEISPAMGDPGFYPLADSVGFEIGEVVWKYEEPTSFWSDFASGVQRQPNGNTLIAEAATGRIFEVTPEGETVWEYINPVTNNGPIADNQEVPSFFEAAPWRKANGIFRAYRYSPDYPGLAGRDLTPKGRIEAVVVSNEDVDLFQESFTLAQNFPNPVRSNTTIQFTSPSSRQVTVTLYNMLGQEVRQLADAFYSAGDHTITLETGDLSAGVYVYQLVSEDIRLSRTMTVVR